MGQKVKPVYGGNTGVVTAIFIRGKNRAYEYSFLSGDGVPTSKTMEEVELEPDNTEKMGF